MREGDLPGGYSARALQRDDLPALLEMITACSIADAGHVRHTLHVLESSYDTEGFVPVTDTSLVLEASGDCAGLAEVYDLDEGHLQPRAYFDIAPAHRKSGIHHHLLAFLDRRLREVANRAAPDARVEAVSVPHPKDSPINQLMTEAGWRVNRYTWEMAIDVAEKPSPPLIPEGFVIREGVAGQDEEPVYRASEETFADHFGFVPTAYDRWLAMIVSYLESPPNLWLIAETTGEVDEMAEVAGMALTSLRYREEPETGT